MVQAARSGKQNIVEGCEDGKTSIEMELKLLNIARSSINELREDYQDFIIAHNLTRWQHGHPRFQALQDFTKNHNFLQDYAPYFHVWDIEEMANIGITLCYQVDAMMNAYLRTLEKRFVTEGGIKERMHAARTGYRQAQDERLRQLERLTTEQQTTIQQLHATITQQQATIQQLETELTDLKKTENGKVFLGED